MARSSLVRHASPFKGSRLGRAIPHAAIEERNQSKSKSVDCSKPDRKYLRWLFTLKAPWMEGQFKIFKMAASLPGLQSTLPLLLFFVLTSSKVSNFINN